MREFFKRQFLTTNLNRRGMCFVSCILIYLKLLDLCYLLFAPYCSSFWFWHRSGLIISPNMNTSMNGGFSKTEYSMKLEHLIFGSAQRALAQRSRKIYLVARTRRCAREVYARAMLGLHCGQFYSHVESVKKAFFFQTCPFKNDTHFELL